MFWTQALKTTLRAKRRSLLFLSLLALISALLATSLGMSAALYRALSLCRENFSTIGLAEYLGRSYPDLSQWDSELLAAAAAMEDSLPESDSLLSYEPTRMALADTPGLRSRSSFDSTVLAVKVNRYISANRYYLVTVQQELFSSRDVDQKMICLQVEGDVLTPGHVYLVHGAYYTGETNTYATYPTVLAAEYTTPGDSLTLPAWQDITTETGYAIPGNSPYLTAAETYTSQSRALTLWQSDAPQDLYPFHENILTLAEGSWPSAGGCLLSQGIAQNLGLSVGDSLTLSTAARADSLPLDSYLSNLGFDTEDTYRLDGIFTGSDDWLYTVFAPVDETVPTTLGSYTLGQLKLSNDSYQSYLDSLELPAGVRITVYDQGYAAAESSLGTMLRSVGVISAVCLLVGIAFLLLFAYLLIFRQQSVARNMIRLGVPLRDILCYDGCCAFFPALAGCLLGFGISLVSCQVLFRVVTSVLEQESRSDLLYSNSALSVSRSATEFLTAPPLWLLLLLSLGVLLLAVLFSVLFGALSLRNHRRRRRALPGRTAVRSRSLRGVGLKYAWLSLCRGGLRSAVPVVALLSAALLFCRLNAVTLQGHASLDTLQQENSVRGYLTNSSGRSLDGLLVEASTAETLASLPGISDLTLTRASNYDLIYVQHQDGSVSGPGYHPRTEGIYAQESFLNYLHSCSELIFTSSLHGAPEFLYAKSFSAEYLPGWDESLFTAPRGEQVPCALPTTLMEEYGISLGDTVTLEIPGDGGTTQGSAVSFTMDFLVVCAFVQEGAADRIYVPLSLFEPWEGPQISLSIYYQERLVDGRTQMHIYYSKPLSYQSATFTISDCSQLDSVKNALYEIGFSETNHLRPIRSFLTLNDASYLSSLHAAQQRLWYMERLFPLLNALAVALAFFLGRLLLGRRAGEIRTLRSMGASPSTTFWSLAWEQLLLVLPGVGLGIALCTALGEWCRTGALWLLAFTLSYLLGALAALLRANRRRILKNRREQEA